MGEESDSMSTMATQICTQIASVFTKPSKTPSPLTLLVDQITATAAQNGHIFVYGVGREGLMMKALCMRLYHLGLLAHCVFDMTTPPIGPPDLLIASAGPGGFSTVDAICGLARSNGARVLLLTAQPESGSSCVNQATVVAHVPAQTMADDHDGAGHVEESRPLLPMGSLYEGALYVLFEMVVFSILAPELLPTHLDVVDMLNGVGKPESYEGILQQCLAECTFKKHVLMGFLCTMTKKARELQLNGSLFVELVVSSMSLRACPPKTTSVFGNIVPSPCDASHIMSLIGPQQPSVPFSNGVILRTARAFSSSYISNNVHKRCIRAPHVKKFR
ncbi:hypothetical protein Cgig2_025381 [Carnegiea gigantea]|uniref:SIS domain-containing protein n=1 Tax=Carnegiea gigantea TaxID=171969 RepID=A0A9Q1GVD0_9CARY|nr:hypothetical protein Cgig2_025381 [Carnegiea gigantea]